MRETRPILPVSLLMRGRRILVVGGGRVAARKLGLFRRSGALIRVVAPTIKEAIRAAAVADSDHLELLERPFEDNDLNAVDVVCCATDDPALNQRVLREARHRGILGMAADSHWPEGDFIMPATIFTDDFTVSISTGGKACRRARQLKDNLSRHLELLGDLDQFVFGVDHLDTPFAELEQALKTVDDSLPLLRTLLGLHEFFVLRTCNRLEIHGIISRDRETETVIRRLLGWPATAYFHRGLSAAEHLALVSAGLRSQAPGEKHIVAQVKESVAQSQKKGFAGAGVQSMLDQALEGSRFIRRRFSLTAATDEVEDLAIRWIKTRARPPRAPLIIGRGALGKALKRALPNAVMISGRDHEACRELAGKSDVIIAATRSPGFVLTAADADRVRPGTALVDVSMPANIDPDLGTVINLNALKRLFPVSGRDELLAEGRRLFEEWRGQQ
ncbi:MAG: NAD(P)-dependent oxidoreductase [Lentisphaeria bacterium]|nr:NAD(P)-dependent oxidoreductase [Lentisphaeria bacterium]